MKDKHVKWVLLLPALVLLFATTVYPLIYSFYVSLHNWNLGRSIAIGPYIGIGNYVRAFKDPLFWQSTTATIIFTVSSVILTITLALLVAILLSKDKPHVSYLRSILIIPFAMSPALIGFSWRFMLEPGYGLFHKIIGTFIPPLSGVSWLADPFYAMVALISVEVWIFMPLMTLIFVSGLMSLPKEVYEAAKVDGANAFQIFLKVTLPLMMPIIMIAIILMTMFALKVFDPVVTLTQGGPGNSTRLLNFTVYQIGFRFFDMGYSAALGYILAFILIGIQSIYMKILIRGGGWR